MISTCSRRVNWLARPPIQREIVILTTSVRRNRITITIVFDAPLLSKCFNFGIVPYQISFAESIFVVPLILVVNRSFIAGRIMQCISQWNQVSHFGAILVRIQKRVQPQTHQWLYEFSSVL